MIRAALFVYLLWGYNSWAESIRTNSVVFESAPSWVTESMIERTVSGIEDKLEWDIRKIKAVWVSDLKEFDKKHGYGPSVTAFSLKSENTIYVSSRVDAQSFEGTFGHELVHVVLFQKYKTAIPKWIEEGFANYFSRHKKANYSELKKIKLPDIKLMQHPFKNRVQGLSHEHYYMVSLALTEMLAAKCDLQDLVQLSVGKNLENYIQKTCGIADLQQEFARWVQSRP
jgi:hypothetical protein